MPDPILLGDEIARALGLREGLSLSAVAGGGGGPEVLSLSPSPARAIFVPVEIGEAEGVRRPAFLRLRPLTGDGVGDGGFDAWRFEHRWLRGALTPLAASLRPLPGVEGPGAGAGGSVLPPLLYCREKHVWIGAICVECEKELPGSVAGARCASCGRARAAGAPPVEPMTSLERIARRLAVHPSKGSSAGSAVAWLPCATCPNRSACFPSKEAGPLAVERLVPLVDAPSGALLVEPFDLPLRAWLRLATGERWSAVRKELASWPPSHVTRLDGVFGPGRPTLLGPEHGPLFALETLLLRLEILRQLLEGLSALAAGPGRPHLGLAPDAIAVGLAAPDVWGSPLWTSRARILDVSRAAGESAEDLAPPADRPPTLVSADCRPSAWTQGRCLPRAAGGEFAGMKSWDFHFLPHPSTDKVPSRGTRVAFSADVGGRPAGGTIEGLIDVAFSDVWMVGVPEPARFEAALRELIARDDGRPLIVMRPVTEHGLLDDLFAIGTLWLASLTVDPGGLDLAVTLREALRDRGGKAPGGYVAAAKGLGFVHYQAQEDGSERSLPVEILESILDLGNRLCGGVPGAWPGQSHEPVDPARRRQVLRDFVSEVEALARMVRHRIFGFSAEDAELRAALESLVREG